MTDKRFELEFDVSFRRLKDNETNITYMLSDIPDLLNSQNTQINILEEENEQLKEELKLEQDFASRWQKESEMLAKENEQLKQKLENIGLNEKNDMVKMIDGKVFIRM